MIKKILSAGLLLLVLQSTVHASLVSARNHEISKLSICPIQPSVMILEGPLAPSYMHYLRNLSEFTQRYQLVDRGQFGVQHSACRALPASSAIEFMDDVFAMYIIAIDYQSNAQPKTMKIQVMRTDTGEVIYQKNAVIGKDFPTVHDFTRTVTPEWIAVLTKQKNQCLNHFTAMVIEDVQMRCHGQLPSATEYHVDSDFRLVFEIHNLDITAREYTQNLNGMMSIEPKPAKTTQRLLLQQKSNACTFSMASEKVLDIHLQPRQLAAILHLTIPRNLSQTWIFEPHIISAEPFFTGDAVEEHTVITDGGTNCPARSNIKKEVSQLEFADSNLVKFSFQEMNPFCSASDFIQPVFIRAPNFGTPIHYDITTSCTHSALAASVTFKRRFFR